MKTQAERERYRLKYVGVDFRKHPDRYAIGRGEEGVLLAEPYKSELLPHWRFATVSVARRSAETIHGMFLAYLEAGEFVGADLARKFLQMGMTRARRYANHKSGRKYVGVVPSALRGLSGSHGRAEAPRDVDDEKAAAAAVFQEYWNRARTHDIYEQWKAAHIERQRRRRAARS